MIVLVFTNSFHIFLRQNRIFIVQYKFWQYDLGMEFKEWDCLIFGLFTCIFPKFAMLYCNFLSSAILRQGNAYLQHSSSNRQQSLQYEYNSRIWTVPYPHNPYWEDWFQLVWYALHIFSGVRYLTLIIFIYCGNVQVCCCLI